MNRRTGGTGTVNRPSRLDGWTVWRLVVDRTAGCWLSGRSVEAYGRQVGRSGRLVAWFGRPVSRFGRPVGLVSRLAGPVRRLAGPVGVGRSGSPVRRLAGPVGRSAGPVAGSSIRLVGQPNQATGIWLQRSDDDMFWLVTQKHGLSLFVYTRSLSFNS